MKLYTILLFFVCLCHAHGTRSQSWKLAEAPLMTGWAEDIDPENVLGEYPRPVMQRGEWKNLNGIWEFQQAEQGDPIPFGKELKDRILVPFPWESALSGIRKQFNSRRAWYRREFNIPEDWKDQRILLHFGAVDWESIVFINGRYAGSHKGGYDPFFFDITSFLKDEGKQEILVGVYDPGNDEGIAVGKQNNSKFDEPSRFTYTPSSGIWQTVWLEPVPEVYISDIRIFPDIDAERIAVRVNPSENTGEPYFRIRVYEGESLKGEGTGRYNRDIFVPVPEPKLWSPGEPFLYDVEILLRDSAGVIDRVMSYTGMRKISLGQEHGVQRLYLNNEFLFQMGPLDQGYWPDGIYTAPTDEALKWDVEMMKEFGYNMVRKHIKIEPQRWYYWCDKLGLLVWQDMPSTFKLRTGEEKTQFEWELDQMVKTHWNHPSIIIWIVFNEHWGLYDPERLTENVMALDPSRLVTANSGIDAGKPDLDFEVGHIRDNHHYRPPTSPYGSNKRAIVCGEYGAIGYNIEEHLWDEDGPWVHYNYKGKEDATAEYERFIEMIRDFQKEGLSAAVYTQWTDLENEMNGIYTYDRKVIKLDKDRVTKANRSTYLVPNKIEFRER